MLKYIGKRVLLMIPVVLGISFILFTIMEFSPGDPARIILGDYATQEQVDELREEMGTAGMCSMPHREISASPTAPIPQWWGRSRPVSLSR